MMMQAGKPPSDRLYTSASHCTRVILRTEGWRAFFSGAWTNTLRGSGAAIVLVLYDEIQKLMKHY
jgi:solute carrier family 25 (adenine nucleotide translocator) protein 4/5/6/31